MLGSSVDERLLTVLEAARVDTIDDVIRCMCAIDAQLPPEDGLKWFNRLYLMVTEEIGRDLDHNRWEDGVWLERLDVIFARLYFDAIKLGLRAPTDAPCAWKALLERRLRPGIAGVQFGVAGMNAHINRDLPVAVVRTCEELGVCPQHYTPQHADYTRVNRILEAIEVKAMRQLATGLLGRIARGLGRLHDRLVMWPVREARAVAWRHAEELWILRQAPARADLYVDRLDRWSGFAGRQLLLPTEPFATKPRELLPREAVIDLYPRREAAAVAL